jgi:hypothetical protein
MYAAKVLGVTEKEFYETSYDWIQKSLILHSAETKAQNEQAKKNQSG